MQANLIFAIGNALIELNPYLYNPPILVYKANFSLTRGLVMQRLRAAKIPFTGAGGKCVDNVNRDGILPLLLVFPASSSMLAYGD